MEHLQELASFYDDFYQTNNVKGLFAPTDRKSTLLIQVPLLSKTGGTRYPDTVNVMDGHLQEFKIAVYGDQYLVFSKTDPTLGPVESLRFLPGSKKWRGHLLILRLDVNGEFSSIENFVQRIQAESALLCFARGGEDYIANTDIDADLQARIYNPDRFLSAKINDLPFDVLSYIFETCLPPSDNKKTRFLTPRSDCPPFTFRKVCSQWRQFASLTSSLWTSVSAPPFSSGSNQRQFFNFWLSLSTSPLSIRYNIPYHSITRHVNLNGRTIYTTSPIYTSRTLSSFRVHAAEMLATMIENEARWTTFEGVFNGLDLTSFTYAIRTRKTLGISVFAAGLTQLKLKFTGVFWANNRISMDDLLAWIVELPALVELDFVDSVHSLIATDEHLRFGRLRQLHLDFRMSTNDSALILSGCSVAESVILQGRSSLLSEPIPFHRIDFNSDLSSSPQNLARLTHLQLLKIQHPMTVLSQFDLPSLEDLVVTSGIAEYPDAAPSVAQLAKFLDRSQCHLKRLMLWDSAITTKDASTFLSIAAKHGVRMMAMDFDMSKGPLFETLMTHNSHRWFRNGPSFDAWTITCDHDKKQQPHFSRCTEHIIGWKDLTESEVLRWRVEKGVTHKYLYI